MATNGLLMLITMFEGQRSKDGYRYEEFGNFLVVIRKYLLGKVAIYFYKLKNMRIKLEENCVQSEER